MPKKININCDFGGQIAPFTVVIGSPEPSHHPLHFQADWLSKNRGGTIPAEVMDAIGNLHDLAKKNNVLLEELCVYALGNEDDPEAIEKANDTEQGMGSTEGGDTNEDDFTSDDEDLDAILDSISEDLMDLDDEDNSADDGDDEELSQDHVSN